MKQKKILFGLGHPAHYHLFKNVFDAFEKKNIAFTIVITNKDILKKLLDDSKKDYIVLGEKLNNKSILGKGIKLFLTTLQLLIIVLKTKPHVMAGCMSQLVWVARLTFKPSLFFAEDDYAYTKLQGDITYPYVNHILSPDCVNVGKYSNKKINYSGFHKLAYLHPNRFTPDRSKVDIPEDTRFFILRFANLKAYHDVNAEGISNEIAGKLIDKLKACGKVLISSERALPKEFEQYRFRGNINDIHHYMAFADMYIGDSQSMAVESAILGTPGIRFNKFVGKISVLAELEEKYKLSFGIHTDDVENLFSKVDELLQNENLKCQFIERRDNMLADKIDVTAFMVWFIENYPESAQIMKENPEYQNRFK